MGIGVVSSGKILGIIGNPLSHSLSPVFQNYLCKKYSPSYVYIPFVLNENGAGDFFKGIRRIENLRGFNVTIPFKEEAYLLSDCLSDEAKKIGAVNTIIVEDNKCYGYNTDVSGILNTLEQDLGIAGLKGRDAVLLGAGGAAKAAVYALSILKARRVFLINRDFSRGQAVKKWAESAAEIEVHLKTWGDIDTIPGKSGIELVINATPIGLKGELLPLNLNLLDEKTAIFDMVYGINRTPVVNNALRLGRKAVDGIGMLVYQGVKSFYLWTGKEADAAGVIKFIKKKVGYGKDFSNR